MFIRFFVRLLSFYPKYTQYELNEHLLRAIRAFMFLSHHIMDLITPDVTMVKG